MWRRVAAIPIWIVSSVLAQEAEPEGLLANAKARAAENLARIPDFTCGLTVDRSQRAAPKAAWMRADTLRLEVTLIGNQERYAWPGNSAFEDRHLAELVKRGTVGTGSFAVHARNVLVAAGAEFIWSGPAELQNGSKALRYDYEVPAAQSRYRIRNGTEEAVVGFRGAIWLDPENLDLVKLMVHADEIPPALGIVSVTETVEYARVKLSTGVFWMPRASELLTETSHGDASRNMTVYTDCRQYSAESKISFTATDETSVTASVAAAPIQVPSRAILELSLDADIDLAKAAAGEPVLATVAKDLKDAEKILIPEGTRVRGRIVRIDRESQPSPLYIVGLEMHTLEFAEGPRVLRATLEDVSGGPGLIRDVKSMSSMFNGKRERTPALSLLTRGQQRGSGMIHWDAKHPRIKKGFRMKWRTEEASEVNETRP